MLEISVVEATAWSPIPHRALSKFSFHSISRIGLRLRAVNGNNNRNHSNHRTNTENSNSINNSNTSNNRNHSNNTSKDN